MKQTLQTVLASLFFVRSETTNDPAPPERFAEASERPGSAGALRRGERTTNKRRVSRQAFTLVELMVVLAIVALLAGLVSINVRAARERARTTMCKSNLRQYGVALNKYFADFDNYFMMPNTAGGSGTGIQTAPGAVLTKSGSFTWDKASGGKYSSLYQGDTAVGGAEYQSYGETFVPGYVRLGSTAAQKQGDVTVCPEVDLDIFSTNSPMFKGYYDTGDFADADYVGSITTYGINCEQKTKSRVNIPNPHQVMAFADWNAAQGWWGNIYYATQTWYLSQATAGSAVKNKYPVSAGGSKGDAGYHTELGFHHRSGTNRIANYVAMDGHVGSISSNAPQSEFYQLFYGTNSP